MSTQDTQLFGFCQMLPLSALFCISSSSYQRGVPRSKMSESMRYLGSKARAFNPMNVALFYGKLRCRQTQSRPVFVLNFGLKSAKKHLLLLLWVKSLYNHCAYISNTDWQLREYVINAIYRTCWSVTLHKCHQTKLCNYSSAYCMHSSYLFYFIFYTGTYSTSVMKKICACV